MSFDIYGNTLRSGHCEVHPHVHEEYPCSVCIAEASQREQQQRPPYCDGDPRFCESAHYLAQASEHIKDQERTMATQQARIEALEKGLQAVAQLIEESSGVSGLHMNGDVAPWSDLQTGGRFEEWLVDFDAALLQEPNK